MQAREVTIRDLPGQVPFAVFEMPETPTLTLYHSLVVPPGEQSNLAYDYVSLAYTRSVDGQPWNLWIAQCDQPLWDGPNLSWRTDGEFRVNEEHDGYLLCRLKFSRDGTYLHMESSLVDLDQLMEDARSLQPIGDS